MSDEAERRARVQGDVADGHVSGTVEWWEHEAAWGDYAKRFGTQQSAQRIHERGGFSYAELADHLGHAPTTWEARVPQGRTLEPGDESEQPRCASCGGTGRVPGMVTFGQPPQGAGWGDVPCPACAGELPLGGER